MSTKTRKPKPVNSSPRKQPPSRSPNSGRVVDTSGNPVPALPQSSSDQLMTLPGFASLTPRQQAALPVVALSPSLAQAARWSGVSESTLRRWQADPAFEQLVLRVRQDASLHASQEIHSLIPRCVAIFSEAMDSPDLAMRLRAARYALALVGRFGESERIATDMQALESAFQIAPKP